LEKKITKPFKFEEDDKKRLSKAREKKDCKRILTIHLEQLPFFHGRLTTQLNGSRILLFLEQGSVNKT